MFPITPAWLLLDATQGQTMCHGCSVLLTYVDESHSKERYFIAGLAVHHEDVRPLEGALNSVVKRAVAELGVGSSRAELHGHSLFHGDGEWAQAKPRQRIAIYNWAFQAITDHDVTIFLAAYASIAALARSAS